MPHEPAPLARPDLPVHIYRLGDEPAYDLSASTTPEERLAMMVVPPAGGQGTRAGPGDRGLSR